MTHQQKRCHHCSVTYSYQGSGHGCSEPTNDPDYCTDCKKIILDALSSVPARRKRDWIVTSDYSVETLVKLEADRVASAKAEGKLAITRVPMGLYDMRDPSNHNRGGVVRFEGKTLRYDYWTKAGMVAGVVSVEVERDVGTGAVLGPYEFTDNWYKDGNKPPTLLLDAEPHAQCPESENEVTLGMKPLMARNISSVFFMQSFPMVEESSLATLGEPPLTDVAPNRRGILSASRDYAGGYGKKGFVVEPLPDGALPVYEPVEVHSGQGHEMVNITAAMNGTCCICYRCSKYEGCPNMTTNESGICEDCQAGGPHKGFDEKK